MVSRHLLSLSFFLGVSVSNWGGGAVILVLFVYHVALIIH